MKEIDEESTLVTKHLTVRPIRAEDWPTVCAVWRDFDRSEYRYYDMDQAMLSALDVTEGL